MLSHPRQAGERGWSEGFAFSSRPWRVVNIAGGTPVPLMGFIAAIEAALGKKATKLMRPMQQGDVVATHADPTLLASLTGFVPSASTDETIKKFVAWYKGYMGPRNLSQIFRRNE